MLTRICNRSPFSVGKEENYHKKNDLFKNQMISNLFKNQMISNINNENREEITWTIENKIFIFFKLKQYRYTKMKRKFIKDWNIFLACSLCAMIAVKAGKSLVLFCVHDTYDTLDLKKIVPGLLSASLDTTLDRQLLLLWSRLWFVRSVLWENL